MRDPSWALLLVAVLGVGDAHAAEVYRWTDEAGRVHFGERPPPGGGERIEVPAQAPAETGGGMAERRARQQRMLDAFEYERERKREQEQAAARQRRETAEWCRGLQRRLRFLEDAGPIYFRRDDGTRDYLDDEERAARKREIEAQYRRRCTGP